MKKFYLLLILSLTTAPLLKAEEMEHLLSFGLRGGMEKSMLKSDYDMSAKAGPAANLDIRYTFYGSSYNSLQCGFLSGVSIAYSKTKTAGSFTNQFSNTDYLGNQLDYANSADARFVTTNLRVEIPVMFALRASGFLFRAGPKVQIPVSQSTKQTVSNPVIDAYYPAYDVHVVNELITGQLQEADRQQTDNTVDPKLNVLVGAELGYEWNLGGRNRLGLLAYADYHVWNNHKQDATAPAILVSPITDQQNPVPAATVQLSSRSMVSAQHPFQLGIAIYYAFALSKDKYPINHKPKLWKQYSQL